MILDNNGNKNHGTNQLNLLFGCNRFHYMLLSNLSRNGKIIKKYLSRDARKPVFGVSDQVRHKPACTSSEKS